MMTNQSFSYYINANMGSSFIPFLPTRIRRPCRVTEDLWSQARQYSSLAAALSLEGRI